MIESSYMLLIRCYAFKIKVQNFEEFLTNETTPQGSNKNRFFHAGSYCTCHIQSNLVLNSNLKLRKCEVP